MAQTGGTGGTATSTGTGGAVVDPARYTDVKLISSCSGPRGETYSGAWFSVAGPSSSIKPADSSGSFPMTAGGYSGSAAHVTGTAAAGDYAQLGIVMYTGSVLFDASSYDGISFWAKAGAVLPIQVAIAQENNDPAYGLCTTGTTCYNYPRVAVTISTSWTRYVVPFSMMKSDPLPDKSLVPVTPGRVKHFQFAMPPGAFDFWVDEVYFVRAN